jgi:hypothetical protein
VNAKVIEAVSAGNLDEASKISGAVSSKYRTQLMADLAKLVDEKSRWEMPLACLSVRLYQLRFTPFLACCCWH